MLRSGYCRLLRSPCLVPLTLTLVASSAVGPGRGVVLCEQRQGAYAEAEDRIGRLGQKPVDYFDRR